MQIGFPIPEIYMTSYVTKFNDARIFEEPKILHLIDSFLTADEIKHYQSLCIDGWTASPTHENIKYFSKDLYRHYKWDGDWSKMGWLDSSPLDWERLYDRIAEYLPPHRIHWVDLKITPPLSTGTPLHRDKDPWIEENTDRDFYKSLSIICNLNTEWQESWGGSFVLHQAKNQDGQLTYQSKIRIPIKPGQLIITENTFHSIETITANEKYRISFILHVLAYR